MPVVPISNFNQASLVVDDVYIVVARPASTSIQGVPTGIVGFVGGAGWGPINSPVSFGSPADAASNFGPVTTNSADIMTDVVFAFQQGITQGVGVRVADGTQAKATGSIVSAASGTVTIAGTIHLADIVTIVLAGVSYAYPLATGDTTATLAAASIAAALNLNSTFNSSFSATSAAGVVTITSFSASNATTLTCAVTGGSATTTATASAATLLGGGVAINNLSGYYFGSEGNYVSAQCIPGTNSTVALPTWTLKISRSGISPASEIYPNLPQATLGAAITNALALGTSSQRGPSELTTGAAGTSTPAPAQSVVTLTGGVNGDATILTSSQLGSITATPNTGMYALAELGVQKFVLCGNTDSAAWTSMAAFGLSAGALAVCAFPPNTSTAAAVASKKAAGIDTEYACFVKDWVSIQDTQNNQRRLISPAAHAVGIIAALSPEQSPENKSINGILGTERTIAKQPYLANELAALQAAGIMTITNPSPGGDYFGLRNGQNASSNSATNGIEWTNMTNFIAYSLFKAFGKSIGQNQRAQPIDPVRSACERRLNNFFGQLKKNGKIDDYNVDMSFGEGKVNTAAQVGDGFMIAKVMVRYLSTVKYFIVMLVGGKTVVVQPQ